MNPILLRACFNQVRTQGVLVHYLTNDVTVNDCANITLAIGARPIMATAPEEVVDIVQLAQALVLNIGTLSQASLDAMVLAGQAAKEKGIPIIFDPVGAGASTFRDQAAQRILAKVQPTIIRGNASEIADLKGEAVVTQGVDSGKVEGNLTQIRQDLALREAAIVVQTGPQDIITDGQQTYRVDNGLAQMGLISGNGYMLTSLVGAFAGSNPDHLVEAALLATLAMGISGEEAWTKSQGRGNGSFHLEIHNAISHLSADTLLEKGRFHEA